MVSVRQIFHILIYASVTKEGHQRRTFSERRSALTTIFSGRSFLPPPDIHLEDQQQTIPPKQNTIVNALTVS